MPGWWWEDAEEMTINTHGSTNPLASTDASESAESHVITAWRVTLGSMKATDIKQTLWIPKEVKTEVTLTWKLLKHSFQRLMLLKLIYLKPFLTPRSWHASLLVIKRWTLLMFNHIITLVKPKCTAKNCIKKYNCQKKMEIKSFSAQSRKIVFSVISRTKMPETTISLPAFKDEANSIILAPAADRGPDCLVRQIGLWIKRTPLCFLGYYLRIGAVDKVGSG